MDRIDEINDFMHRMSDGLPPGMRLPPGKYNMSEADYCCGTSVSISRAG